MRHCAWYCKLVYTTRTTPLSLFQDALQDFDDATRSAVEAIGGTAMDDFNLLLCRLGIKQGGLGIRAVRDHAAAAYVASTSAVAELAKAIDPQYDPEGLEGGR